MTGPCRSLPGSDAVRHTDEVFEALAAGRPVSCEEETISLLQALVTDVRLDGTSHDQRAPEAVQRSAPERAERAERAERVDRAEWAQRARVIRGSRGPLRCR